MTQACAALGLSRATAYRRLRPRRPVPDSDPARPRSHRRIPDEERAAILKLLDSKRFIDQPPREVYAALLSEGTFSCSWRTMYRLLRERGPVRDRRNQRDARHNAVPRLIASAPNQVWTWDITKLATCERGVFLNLYVVLDLFSRYVVAWMVAGHENSALAKQLFREAIERYGIAAGTLTVHQDRGAPMTSHGFADLLGELGIERSYSRPRVSDDNAFSEAHFHTLSITVENGATEEIAAERIYDAVQGRLNADPASLPVRVYLVGRHVLFDWNPRYDFNRDGESVFDGFAMQTPEFAGDEDYFPRLELIANTHPKLSAVISGGARTPGERAVQHQQVALAREYGPVLLGKGSVVFASGFMPVDVGSDDNLRSVTFGEAAERCFDDCNSGDVIEDWGASRSPPPPPSRARILADTIPS